MTHYDDHRNGLAMRDHACRPGERAYLAAGAGKTIRRPPFAAVRRITIA